MATSKTIYKQLPLSVATNRTIKPLTAQKRATVRSTVSKFITYLKAAHS